LSTLLMILPFGLGLRFWLYFPDQPVREPLAYC
jgi:hypothetical protein